MRIALLALLLAAPLHAKTSSRGSVGLEGRAFYPDDDDANEDYGGLLVGRLEFAGKHGVVREKVRAVGRAAYFDPDRSNLVVEEAWAQLRTKYVRVTAGLELLNWTATEAFHPADVINSRNFDGNVENPDKIGEPMVEVELRLPGDVYVNAYYMPLRMDPILPGADSRLSFGGTGVSLGDPLWVGRDGTLTDEHVEHQWAARVATTLGSADIALHALQHNDRAGPGIALDGTQPRPLYHFVTQYGLTYAHALADILLKVEAAHRRYGSLDDPGRWFPVAGADRPDHTIVAAGLEYGWSYEESGQGTVLLEGQAIVDVSDAKERKALDPFQRDVLVGYRHELDDIAGTAITTGVIVDLEDAPGIVANLQYRRRLGEVWSVEGSLRLVFVDDPDSPFEALDGDHYLQLALLRHF